MGKNIQTFVDELFDVAALYGKHQAEEKAEDTTRHESKMRDMAKREVLNFLMYLSASDGSIEVQEALFIKDYFGEQISPEEICERIEADNLYSATFEQKIPLVLKRLIKLDNENEKNGELEVSQGEWYICLYEAIGKEFTACDREISESERSDLNTYISNMRSFYKANYKGSQKATDAAHFEHTVSAKSSSTDTVRNRQKKSKDEDVEETEETLEELLAQLKNLVGLDSVKFSVNQLIHFNTIRCIRNERDLKQPPMTMHMVFYGNPGTGKTTVARLIAKIYHKLGILSKGHLVEVDRSRLVAGYVGHTALKVNEVVEKAKGGVLFIDEAYSLTYRRSENDFGWEAVDTLIKAMEDYRDDLVVIVAGYPERMVEFIDSNPGLRSRFNKFIEFADYDSEELFEIYKRMLADSGFCATDDTLDFVEEWLEEKEVVQHDGNAPRYGLKLRPKKTMLENKENFANARIVRNFLETSIMNQADRLYDKRETVSNEELTTIEIEDVKNIA